MKPLNYITPLVAIVFLALFLYQCGRNNDSDLSKNAEISRLQAKDQENAQLQDSLNRFIALQEHARDSTEKASNKSDSLFQVEKRGRQVDRRELRALRIANGVTPDTVTLLIESNFEDQVKADSVQIGQLETRLVADSTSFRAQLHAWTEKLASQVLTTDGWRIQAVESTKDAQKFKRQRNTALLISIGEALLIVLMALL